MTDELGLDLERLLRQRGWLRALARGLVSEGEVDDLLQESWLAALSARSRSRRSLRAWFAGLARNAARGVRRGKGGAEPEWEALGDTRPAAGELLAQAELQERLIAAVRALREPYRATVLLHYFEELSLEEVGRRMGVPSSTARTRLARALAELREQFERERGGAAWALVVALARGSAAGITSSVVEVALMGTLAKVSVGVVAVAGLALVVWTRLEGPDPGERAAREARVAPNPAESSRGAEPAVVAPARVESSRSAPIVRDTASEVATAAAAPEAGQSEAPAVASSPLERRLETIADTFLTEEPDVAGLMLLSNALADAVSVLPDSLEVHESGSVTGKFDAVGNLQGTFSCLSGSRGLEYHVELSSWNTPAPFPRQLSLQFTEEGGAVSSAQIKVQSIPMRDASNPIGGQELIGWRLVIDGEGAQIHRTSMLVEDLNPSSNHYLYQTHDVRGVEPHKMPWIRTDALDPWLTRLRALRPR